MLAGTTHGLGWATIVALSVKTAALTNKSFKVFIITGFINSTDAIIVQKSVTEKY